MNINTKIPDVKDLLWKIALQVFKNKPLINNLFPTDIGKQLIEKLDQKSDISKFQWNFKSKEKSEDLT